MIYWIPKITKVKSKSSLKTDNMSNDNDQTRGDKIKIISKDMRIGDSKKENNVSNIIYDSIGFE